MTDLIAEDRARLRALCDAAEQFPPDDPRSRLSTDPATIRALLEQLRFMERGGSRALGMIRMALDELPQPGYPAPVTVAVETLNAALAALDRALEGK